MSCDKVVVCFAYNNIVHMDVPRFSNSSRLLSARHLILDCILELNDHHSCFGMSLGIPLYGLDFMPFNEVITWQWTLNC